MIRLFYGRVRSISEFENLNFHSFLPKLPASCHARHVNIESPPLDFLPCISYHIFA